MLKPNLLIAIVILLSVTNISFAQGKSASSKDFRFLEDISVDAVSVPAVESPAKAFKDQVSFAAKKEVATNSLSIENASSLQLKYAMLLDLEVELIKNLNLFTLIDDWYGTKYRLGGVSKSGIDCSALMQIFFTALYGVALPRTARDQFKFSQRISRTELKEGDLVFFNTRGGVSHVGMYLTNNKFVHASTSGVTISDLYDDYYSSRFIGAGRIDEAESLSSTASATLSR